MTSDERRKQAECKTCNGNGILVVRGKAVRCPGCQPPLPPVESFRDWRIRHGKRPVR